MPTGPQILKSLRCTLAVIAMMACVAPDVALSQSAGIAMLRIACDADAAGAEITVNGELKGECPFDMPVPAGTVKLRALKSLGQERERVFETEFRIGSGTARTVDIELGSIQLTAAGRRLEEERLRRAEAERIRLAEEKARTAAEANVKKRAEIEVRVDALLTKARARRGTENPACPNCPVTVRLQGRAKTDTPSFVDVTTQKMMENVKGELLAYLGNQSGFRPPAERMPLPCEGAEIQLRHLAGFKNLDEAPVAEQQAYLTTSKGGFYYYRDVLIWPVQAVCREGKLDGALEYWIAANQVIDLPTYTIVYPVLVRIRTTLDDGKPADMLRWYMAGDNLSTSMEVAAATSEFFMVTRIMGDPNVSGRSVQIGYKFFTDTAVQDAIEGPDTTVTASLGGGRSETVSWDGERKSSRSLMKNGKMHGEMVLYGYTKSMGFFLPNYEIPTTRYCYRDGQRIEMTPCKVD